MTPIRRIAKNTAVMVVGKITSQAIGFLYIILMARYLGAEEYGILAFAIAFTAIFGIVSDFGLQPLVVREVARYNEKASKYLINLTGIKALLSIMTLVLIVATLYFLNRPPKAAIVVYCISIAVILNSYSMLFQALFQAFQKMELSSMGNVLYTSTILGGVICIIREDGGLFAIAVLYPMAAFVLLLYCLIVTKSKFPETFGQWNTRKWEFDWTFWKTTIKEAYPFGLGLLFMTIFYWVDSVMLSLLKGDQVVGIYNVAYRMVLVLLFIPTALISAIYPVMARYSQNSLEALQISFEKSFKYLTAASIPIAVGMTILGGWLIPAVFGSEYAQAVLPFRILLWSAVLIFMSMPYGNLFNCINRQGIVTTITAFCTIANIGLNLLLIPRYGIVGASMATVAAEFLSLTLSVAWGKRTGHGMPMSTMAGVLIKIILSGILMVVYIYYFPWTNVAILLVSALIIFFGSYYFLFKGIDRTDIWILRSILYKNSERTPHAKKFAS